MYTVMLSVRDLNFRDHGTVNRWAVGSIESTNSFLFIDPSAGTIGTV